MLPVWRFAACVVLGIYVGRATMLLDGAHDATAVMHSPAVGPVRAAPCPRAANTTEALLPSPIPRAALSPLELRMAAVEAAVLSTVKNCLGPKCLDVRPQASPRDRVLVTALPNTGGERLFAALEYVWRATKDTKKNDLPELVFSPRALPFGYGKNHGYSRVIKYTVARTRDAAVALAGAGASPEDAAAALAAAMSWACRQKVGHTRSLVVEAADFAERRPLFELERALSFAGLPVTDRPLLVKALAAQDLPAFGPAEHRPPLADELSEAVVAEGERVLKATRDLQAWPCPPLDPVRWPYLLVNCSAPFAVCSVGHDKKEGAHVGRIAT